MAKREPIDDDFEVPPHPSPDDYGAGCQWTDRGEGEAADSPIPLFPPMPPAERYPVEVLGPVLSRAAAAIAHKIQVPEAIAGQSVLSVAALAAQSHADVMLPYGQARPLSLFFVTVAASGDRKSTADNEALWPVAKREKALREAHTEEMKVYTIEHGAWTAQKKKIEGDGKIDYASRKDRLQELGDEPAKPLFPMLTSGDITLDGLTKNMPQLQPSLGVFTAEAGQFTAGHNMSDDNRLRAAAMLSEIWDGKPIKRVRSLDGVSILPGRRMSMHLLVQPNAAADFLANGTLRDQGLLSRFLAAAPDSIAGARLYRDARSTDDVAIKAYGARILSLLEAPVPLVEDTRNELDPRALPMSVQAEQAWKAFFNHIESQSGRRGDLGPIGDFAAKVAEHAARIAGVLTIVDSINAADINLDAMKNALTLADWYVAEAGRLQQGARTDARLLRASALLEWLQGRTSDEIAFREIVQFGPGALRTKAAAEESVAILVAHGWLAETSPRPRRLKLTRVGDPP